MSKTSSSIHLLGLEIAPGQSAQARLQVAHLHNRTPIEVPVFIEHAIKPGPTLLFLAGIHGDEVNGIEILRQCIAKGITKPRKGTTICIPVVNVIGYVHNQRDLPDGRDLNRAFPGKKTGSLAAQIAHQLTQWVLPHTDLVVDFHTGGAQRFNAPQIRLSQDDPELLKKANVFGAPFIIHSKPTPKSLRHTCDKKGIPLLLFEGGKSNDITPSVSNTGVNGIKRLMYELKMLSPKFTVSKPKYKSIEIVNSSWIRAGSSGMFKPLIEVGRWTEKGANIGQLSDPYGQSSISVLAPNAGYIFNVNQAPTVYQGDALFHISTDIRNGQNEG
ncbi:MAG TPA: succinylglutamate desuccinylase [Flavobacteriaceae bacterium]|jgi:uncharacterized protein|nr:succinylglutamate desuccinylase [Flavobacteriaceae bacterium]